MEQQTVKTKCGKCRTQTNHKLCGDEYVHEATEHVWEERRYQIVQCLGCEELSFRQTYVFSEDWDDVTGRPLLYETLYPDRQDHVEPIKKFERLPEDIRRIYMEVLNALHHKAPLLATFGIRGIVEAICIDRKCEGNALEKKIDGLVGLGHLAEKHAKYLHGIRILGNEAVHEMKLPKNEILLTALDIVETLMKTIYLLENVVDKSLDS